MEIKIETVDLALKTQAGVISKNVKRLRIECGLTQQDLAVAVFMDKSRISDIENCRAKNLTIFTLLKLCSYFDIKLCEVLRDWGSH